MAGINVTVQDQNNITLEVTPTPTQTIQINRGVAGEGIPPGGTTGQVLAKASATNYDTTWVTDGNGTVTSVTAGTGLTGGTITTSGTIAIDSTVATLTGTQTLTNKSISGSTNTLSNIGNASLANSSITINGTPVSLGGSVTTPQGTITSVTGTSPIASSGGTTPAISISQANTSTNGFLSSADWNTFNSKGNGTVTSVTATSPVTSTGGATPIIAMPAATTSVNGYLTSTDWTTFNSKGNGTVTSVSVATANGFKGTVSNATTTPLIAVATSVVGLLKGDGNNVSAATSGTDYAPATSGTSIFYGNGSGGFSNVTIGTNLTFTGGILNASGGITYPTGTGIAVVSGGTAWGTTLTAPSGAIVGTSDTQTLTNKRVSPRVNTTTSSATPTINTDNTDQFGLTAQAVDITSFTTNLSGTPTDGQKLWIYIVGTAARAITWGASFEASTATLPTTTVSTDRLDVGFVWNVATSKWRCVAVA
jgi:hypothetical protein